MNDPDWIRYIGDRNVRSLEDARVYLEKGPIAMYERAGFGMWVMERKGTGEPVGTCGLIRRESLDDVDIGFAMLPQHRGRGFALEASRAVLEYAWNVIGLTRVIAIVSPGNAKSIRLLETIGMRFERKVRMPGDSEEISLYGRNRAGG